MSAAVFILNAIGPLHHWIKKTKQKKPQKTYQFSELYICIERYLREITTQIQRHSLNAPRSIGPNIA